MKARYAVPPSLLVAALVLAPVGARPADGPARIAVLPPPSSAPASAEIATALVDAVRQTGAEPVPPEEVVRAAAAAKQDLATCGSAPACAAAVCAALDARALVAASVTPSGRFWIVGVWLREAKGGWMKGQGVSAVDANARAAQDAATKVVARILPAYLSGSPPATATAPPRPVAAPVPPPPTPVAAPAPLPHPPPAPPVAPAPAPPRAEGPALEVREPPSPSTARRRDARLTAPAPRPGSEAGAGGSRWGVVLAGGGAALLAGGAVTGVLAWSEANAADLALARGDAGTWAVRRRSSQTLVLTTAGIGGVGAAALAAGLWVRFGARSSPVALQVEPATVRLSVAF